jgi:ribonucleoside-diphosphate reductase alpha chain
MIIGPQTKAAEALHAMKYREIGEDFREAMNRIAFALKDDDAHYRELRPILLEQRFLPAGRIQAWAGATRETTPYNCYVSGTIADSYVDGPGSIMARAHEAAATMRQGGGIGYDFSTLRPRGFQVVKLQSAATGPVSFMNIFDAICLCTSSSGHRRGAQMGVLRVDHPDIEEFIRAKHNETRLRGFNVSVAITDAFMEAALNKKTFKLQWGGVAAREVDAAELWEKIMRSTWDWAEPGVIFIDRVNEQNNLRYCEEIAATNPCGEQPLPPNGACLLGSFNLVKYLVKTGPHEIRVPALVGGVPGIYGGWAFDLEALRADVAPVVRAMDNVVDRARYPLAAQRVEGIAKRRMGLGITGLANAAEACGHPYGSVAFLTFETTALRAIANAAYAASALIAKEKGAFPAFDREKYLAAPFIAKLDLQVQELIEKHGIRNSHLTSIAPTGTISMAADNVSSGIEPTFEFRAQRLINTPDGQQEVMIEDYGTAFLGIQGRLSEHVTAREHVAVLCAAQACVDSAVSKTCNVTGAMPWDEFKGIYEEAWTGGAKGCTTFNRDGKRAGMMVAAPASEEGIACGIDGTTGRRECA